jgi:hypothetical protein
MKCATLGAAMFMLILTGCADSQSENHPNYAAKSEERFSIVSPAADAAMAPGPPRGMKPAPKAAASGITQAVQTLGAAGLVAAQPGTAPAGVARKIVYDCQIDLVVDSVDPVAKKVVAFVQESRGYIAEQNVTGSPGSLRSIHWKVRVPVEQFDSLVESIIGLGELERNNRTSQDVTEQFYDIEARIKNKRVEEQTLNKILQERSGKLEDVLKIEIELSRVRGEIEQLEGKIRVLENLSSLATLTLNIRERDKYAPAPPVVATFSTQIARTWSASIQSMVNVGKSIVLWFVAYAIWIPFWVIGALVAFLVARALIRALIRNLPRIIALARMRIAIPGGPPPASS